MWHAPKWLSKSGDWSLSLALGNARKKSWEARVTSVISCVWDSFSSPQLPSRALFLHIRTFPPSLPRWAELRPPTLRALLPAAPIAWLALSTLRFATSPGMTSKDMIVALEYCWDTDWVIAMITMVNILWKSLWLCDEFSGRGVN